MLGLERCTVKLQAHNPTWAEIGQALCHRIKAALGKLAIDVAHIGSTSVYGLTAKPIIDIAVAVHSLDSQIITLMEYAGFWHRPANDDENQLFFVEGKGEWRSAHIHVVRYLSMQWRNYLNFKEYLTAFDEVRGAYAALKRALAERFPNDRVAYTEGKAQFITYHLRKAMVWSYLGMQIQGEVDRPIGYLHIKDDKQLIYPINYGYIPGVLGGDGEELDVYFLGEERPVNSFCGKVIAIAHRSNDVEDKLVACPIDRKFTAQEIAKSIYFQEKFYDTTIETLEGQYLHISNGENYDS